MAYDEHGLVSPEFATLADALDYDGFTTNTDRISITVPASAGGAGSAIAIQLCSDSDGSTSAGSGVIGIGTSGAGAGTVAEAVIDAINGTANGRVHFGSGTSAAGVVGVAASLSGTTKVNLTASLACAAGNGITVANVAGDVAEAGTLSGGVGNSLSPTFTERTGEPHDEHTGDFTMNHFKNMSSYYNHKCPQIPFSRAMSPVRDLRMVVAPLTSDNDVI